MTIKFYLKHPKNSTGELRKTEVSIFAKARKDERNQFEIPTGENILPKYWDFQKQIVKASYVGHVSLQGVLDKFKVKLMDLYRDNREKSFTEYKDIVRGRVQKKTLTEAFAVFLKHLKDQKRDRKTIALYGGLLNYLNAGGYTLESFNSQFPYRFRLLETKEYNMSELGDITYYKHLSRLKTLLHWAKEHGYPTGSEFEKWEIRNLTVQPLSLTEDEMLRLETAELEPDQAIARDYFIVSCRTGLRISDLIALDVTKMLGDTYPLTTTKKVSINGGKKVLLYFAPGTWSEPALNILKSYGGRLPKFGKQTLNVNLRKAADNAKIHALAGKESWKNGEKVVDHSRKCDIMTMHWGRKTYITLALEKGVPSKVLGELAAVTMNVIENNYAAKGDKKVNENYLKQMVKSA